MEPKREQVEGMLKQAAKMIEEVYYLKGVVLGTALQAYLNTAHDCLACAISHVDDEYKEEEDRQ